VCHEKRKKNWLFLRSVVSRRRSPAHALRLAKMNTMNTMMRRSKALVGWNGDFSARVAVLQGFFTSRPSSSSTSAPSTSAPSTSSEKPETIEDVRARVFGNHIGDGLRSGGCLETRRAFARPAMLTRPTLTLSLTRTRSFVLQDGRYSGGRSSAPASPATTPRPGLRETPSWWTSTPNGKRQSCSACRGEAKPRQRRAAASGLAKSSITSV